MYEGKKLSLSIDAERIANLCFDAQGESVNKFDLATVGELGEALTLLEAADDVAGLIVTSGKPTFFVGADITEFSSVFALGAEAIATHLSVNINNFQRLERLPFPTAVAIGGIAVGGGLEFCLACDFRIATRNAELGLPETKLGIIPGWGGTVRLPRIAGVDTAIAWIATGSQYAAQDALIAGVVDAVVEVESLHAAALYTLREAAVGRYNYRLRRDQKRAPMALNTIESRLAFESARGVVFSTAGKHYPAPLMAVTTIEKSATVDAEQAFKIETENFVKVAQGDVAQALTGIFVNDQRLMREAKQWQAKTSSPTEKIAVLGAGIMGGGIACQAAVKGMSVLLKDVQQQGIDLGLAEARSLLGKRVDRGRLTVEKMTETLTRIDPSLSYGDFSSVDFVVEAVVENQTVKQNVLAEVEQNVSPDTILASNTSTISIATLASALMRPENFCGMHFFNPVHAMPLVEVIRGKNTSNHAIAKTVALALKLGKKPVVVGDCPGFLVNRVLFPYFHGFALLLRDGADFSRVDKVMEAWGWPMGPAYLLDVVGLDTAIHAQTVMAEGYPRRMTQDFVSALQLLYQAGRLGQKNQQGFYDYLPDKKGRLKKHKSVDVAGLLEASCKEFTDDEIVARMMLPMLTELTRCLEDEIVASPAEADMAMVYGVGFPPFRGGVFHWADAMGARKLCDMMAKYGHLGELYKPPQLLSEKADRDGKFYE